MIDDKKRHATAVGNAKTSFIDVRDIGLVAATVFENESLLGKNYDLTGNEKLDYWQVANILSNVLNRKITYKNPNPLYFLIEAIRRGTTLPFAVVQTGLYTSTRFGMADVVTDEVEKIIGRKPISFEQYAQDYKENWIN